MDKIFHHKWWDYSNQPLNIGGYVCLLFSLVWGVACVVIVKVIHPFIHKALAFIPVVVGIVLIAALFIVLIADLYVTASGILKLNRKLESMERIAGELRELSDKLGENIHENVLETMEYTEEGLKKFEDATEERHRRIEEAALERHKWVDKAAEEQHRKAEEYMEEIRGRYKELRERYEELSAGRIKVAERLVRAFPKMESRQHKDILEELKKRIKDRL